MEMNQTLAALSWWGEVAGVFICCCSLINFPGYLKLAFGHGIMRICCAEWWLMDGASLTDIHTFN